MTNVLSTFFKSIIIINEKNGTKPFKINGNQFQEHGNRENNAVPFQNKELEYYITFQSIKTTI